MRGIMRYQCAFVGLLLLACFGGQPARAQSSNVTITVTGSGPTADEAKSDAIRQALQITMKQLVVVDRAVSGDSILRDKVMSTMNGYIETFREKALSRSAAGVSMEAEITVSAARIENFIGVIVGGGGAIEGQTIFQEQQRRIAQSKAEQLQRAARGEIMDALLREFPSAAAQIEITRMDISSKDVNKLILQFRYSYKPTFLKALEDTAKALSIGRCSAPRGANEVRGCPADATARFCFFDATVVRCYALSPGEYCKACGKISTGQFRKGIQNYYRLAIFGRFVDSAGASANSGKEQVARRGMFGAPEAFPVALNSGCLYLRSNLEKIGAELFLQEPLYGGATYFFGNIDLVGSYQGSVEVDSSFVDLNRAKYFVGIPVVEVEHVFQPLTFVAGLGRSDVEGRQNVCGHLDGAIQRFMVTK